MIKTNPPIHLFILTAFALSTTTSAQAEGGFQFDIHKFGIDTGVSTFGITITPSYRENQYLGFRMPLGYLAASTKIESDGTSVRGNGALGGVGALMDFYPMSNGLRFTSGAMLPLYRVTGKSNGTSTTINDVTYAVSDLNAHVKTRGIAPYLGFGYQYGNGEAGWSGSFDLGAMFNVGYSSGYTYSANNLTDELKTEFESQADEFLSDIESELNKSGKILPFLSISATYRF